MSANPYQAPGPPGGKSGPVSRSPARSPVLERMLEHNPVGIWNDGKHLVVCMGEAQFPPVCLKRCERFDGPPRPVKLTYAPKAQMLTMLFGLIGAAIAQCLAERKTLHLPISDQWYRQRWKSYLVGVSGFVLGLVVFVLSILVFSAVEAHIPNGIVRGVLLVLAFSTLLIPILSLLYPLRHANRSLSAHKMEGQFVWLQYVSNEYREKFPAWPG